MEHIDEEEYRQITETILLAGRILLESGAETSRVEETIFSMARNFGYYHCEAYVISNIINVSLEEGRAPKIVRIQANTTDLRKIYEVNLVVKRIIHQEIDTFEAEKILKKIDEKTPMYSFIYKVLLAGLISFCFLYLQGGEWINTPSAVIAGMAGFAIAEGIKTKTLVLFIPEFIGAIAIGVLVTLGHALTPDSKLTPVLVAGIMPIVPGVLITSAIQDLFSRHMLTFTAKLLQAIVISFAIGSGLAVSLLFK